jgi:hypothetical protein
MWIVMSWIDFWNARSASSAFLMAAAVASMLFFTAASVSRAQRSISAPLFAVVGTWSGAIRGSPFAGTAATMSFI